MTFAYVIALLTFGLGICVDRLLIATRELKRARRRRREIDTHGTDAVESWLEATDWTALRPSNGTPFQGEPAE
jgi:hypothetical protein